MPEYTKVNLIEDVTDMAPQYDLAPGMQSRFARTNLELEQSGVSLFRLAPGFRVPFGHAHERQEEVYVVLDGSARVKVGEEIVELGRYDAIRFPPGVTHGIEGGPDGVEFLAYGAPNTDNRDAEMLPGWWQD